LKTVPGTQTFAMRYGAIRPLLVALGMGPAWTSIELDDQELEVRMGWAFRTHIPRTSIRGARQESGRVGGIGVHGWRGRWLVNGSMDGIVAVHIDPPARAVAVGLPVRLGYLVLSLEDPEGFVAALT
jgi:hypothetical protein